MFILSKNDSQKIKGLAILCMIFYHLFAFPERIPEKAVLPWMGTDIIKSFSICVPIYLFMAGYGLQCTIMKKGTSISDCFNRVIKLYINYWWVAIPFIIIGTCIHYYYPNNPRVLILNIIGMQSTYNGEWWFYSLYIELLIIFYLSIGKLKLKLLPYTIFMIVLLFLTRIINRVITFEISNIWQHHLHMIIVNLNIFIMGCYFAKFGIFTYIFDKYNKLFRKIYLVPFFLILPLLIRAYLPLKGITDLITIPIFVIGTINLSIYSTKYLQYLGRHSMNLWLIHSFFIYYFLSPITFITSNPIVMLFTVIACSLGCSLIINFAKQKLSSIFI